MGSILNGSSHAILNCSKFPITSPPFSHAKTQDVTVYELLLISPLLLRDLTVHAKSLLNSLQELSTPHGTFHVPTYKQSSYRAASPFLSNSCALFDAAAAPFLAFLLLSSLGITGEPAYTSGAMKYRKGRNSTAISHRKAAAMCHRASSLTSRFTQVDANAWKRKCPQWQQRWLW
jgi:hypothetical protein